MTDEQQQQAIQRIDGFLVWLWAFLRQHCQEGFAYPVTVDERRVWRPLVEPSAQQALAAAWRHYETDHTLDALRGRLRETPRAQLIDHGLYGAQLDAKLRMVRVLLDRCDALWQQVDRVTPAQELVAAWAAPVAPPPSAAERAPRRGGFGGMVKAIKDLITGIDVFADSVFDAVGVGKALKEIKELFGMSLDEPVA